MRLVKSVKVERLVCSDPITRKHHTLKVIPVRVFFLLSGKVSMKLSLPFLAILLGGFLCRHASVSTANAGTTAPKTVNADSCNVSDVQRATNHANAGDTVVIPAGTCTWTSTLTVSTAVTLIGTTRGATVIVDNVDRSRCRDHPAIFLNITANLPWRLANFTIQGSAADPGNCSENVKVVTNSHAFRLDHITFNNMQTTGIKLDGDAWGLIDHCMFNGDHKRGVLIHHTTWGKVGAWGDSSWAQPDTLGTNQAVFVEDSSFNITHALGVGSVACEHGGRCVVRYNNPLPYIGTHGTDSTARVRSIRHIEVYNNTFNDNGAAVTQGMQLRGGTALFFNNTITPTTTRSYTAPIALEIYREVNAFKPWGPASNGYKGGCDGTGPFDNNDGIVYDRGKYNSGSGGRDLLTDSTRHWSTNQWIGYSLRNDTTGPWGSAIESNTDTTITTYPSTTGNPHTWNIGDSYQIVKVYPCLDQPGRGAGDYISGGGFALPGGPARWPHQAIDPVYAWNNRSKSNLVPAVSHYYTHIQPNRDYYDWTANFDGTTGVGQGVLSLRPTTCTPLVAYWAIDTNTLYQCSAKNTWTVYYKPYTYPHPLQGASSAAVGEGHQ